jgi:hypothetical protein
VHALAEDDTPPALERECAVDEQHWIDEQAEIAADLTGFFLGRLASLVVRLLAAASPAEQRRLGLAMFTAFFNCLELGFEEQASALLEQLRDTKDLYDGLAA